MAYGERGIEGAIPGTLHYSMHIQLFNPSLILYSTGGATLIFSVELLELRKPSMLSWNRDTVTIVCVVALVGLVLFEVYRRCLKEDAEMKEQKKLSKKGSKKKR